MPTQVAVTGRTGRSTDCYSFGIVLCECASKLSPWMLVDGAYIANPYFPCHSPSMPAAYAQLATRCMDLDKDKRPKFAEIVSSLEVNFPAQVPELSQHMCWAANRAAN